MRITSCLLGVLSILFSTRISLGAAFQEGRTVGRLQIEFAKQIARDGVPMTEELAQWLGDTADGQDCDPDPEKLRGLDRDRRRLLRLYIKKVCKPYMQLWQGGIAPCIEEPPAGWCGNEEGLAEHVDLEGYFASITAGIQNAQSKIERDALMVAVISTLSTHVMTEFPQASLARWASGAMEAYIRGDSPEDILRFARQLKETWIPQSTEIAHMLREYARSSALVTREQFDEFNSLSDEFASE